jgi:hypothetical protein
LSQFVAKSETPGFEGAGQAESEVALQATTLRGIIEETRQQSAWPIKTPAAMRIFITALIPIAYFILEEVIRGWWLS